MTRGRVRASGNGYCAGYRRAAEEVREASLGARAALELSLTRDAGAWRATVDDLRALLVGLPLDAVVTAAVAHRSLLAYMASTDAADRWAYDANPELWDRVVLDPCGLQVLTDRHLEAAHDLSGWRTTRLGPGHLLVEARDLDPWYEPAYTAFEAVRADVLDAARDDFGDMVLTSARADALGLPRPSWLSS